MGNTIQWDNVNSGANYGSMFYGFPSSPISKTQALPAFIFSPTPLVTGSSANNDREYYNLWAQNQNPPANPNPNGSSA